MTPERDAVLAAVVARIESLDPGHPVRVAIDGPDAAGKSTLADELAGRLAAAGRPVIRASADDFARPRADRHRRGRRSPDGYRLDGLDLAALRAALLDPLGPGGDRRYRTRSFDLDADRPVREAARPAPPNAVLLVDGVFLGRRELAGEWDLRVFVTVPPEVTLRRALDRDVPRLGTAAEVEALYRARYLPAQATYLERDRPLETADLVLDHADPDHPALRARG
jgi:uridine kinase